MNILHGFDKHSILSYFRDVCDKNPKGLKVFGVEAIVVDCDEGRRYQKLCQREPFWIHQLGSLSLEGLNESLNVHTLV